MTIVETTLIFAGIPVAAFAVLAVAVYGPEEFRQPNRYRPGRPWRFAPVWYLPHPEHVSPDASHREALSAPHRAAVEGGDRPAPTPAAVGGAVGEW